MKTWVKALLGGALALGPAAAFAAIDNTHHDMPYLSIGIQERCAYCHAKVGLTSGASTALGKVGNFCVAVCHMAGSGVAAQRTNAIPTSPGNFTYAGGSFTVANGANDATIFTGGHLRLVSGLNAFNATEATNIPNTGWPYTQVNELQCTSCHSVHDASRPPFLNARLSEGASQTEGLCARCHSDIGLRTQNFAAAGNHPTEFKWSVTAANGRNSDKGDGTIMNGRDLVNGVPTVINVMATNVADGAGATALNALNANWNMGGHVVSNLTGLPTSGASATATDDTFGCYSCHAVHQTAPAWNGSVATPLTVGSDMTDVCYGCHTMEPGRTGFGHPIDEDEPLNHGLGGGNWDVVPVLAASIAAIPAAFRPAADNKAPVKAGALNAPYCVTCHDVHGGRANRMAIINYGIAYSNNAAGDQAVCELCHFGNGSTAVPNPNAFGNPSTANKHHPGATTLNYVSADGFIQDTAWRTLDGLGDLEDGLSCGDCHVGDGTPSKRATAHNWQ